jgi:hypothetical protein
VNLDNRGLKAMPGPCISCHGGRGDALTPPDSTGRKRFNLVQNAVSQSRGDVQARPARLRGRRVRLSRRSRAGRARSRKQDQDDQHVDPVLLPHRPPSLASGGRVPPTRARASGRRRRPRLDQARLRRRRAPLGRIPRRVCAVRRGRLPGRARSIGKSSRPRAGPAMPCAAPTAQSDVDFDSYDKFVSFAPRIKAHLIDPRQHAARPDPLQRVLGGPRSAAAARRLPPGARAHGPRFRGQRAASRPPALPIPARSRRESRQPYACRARTASMPMDTRGRSSPAPRVGRSPSSSAARATLNAPAMGTYVVQLVASNGSAQSAPRADSRGRDDRPYAGARGHPVRRHQGGHAGPGLLHDLPQPYRAIPRPPVYYTNEDRNGDGSVGDATDDPLVLRGGEEPDQLHRAGSEPAAHEALEQPPRRPADHGLRHQQAAGRPGARALRTCSRTGS